MNTTALAALSGVTAVAIALALGYLARIRIPDRPSASTRPGTSPWSASAWCWLRCWISRCRLPWW